MTAAPAGEIKAPEENSSTVNPFAETTEGTEPAKPDPETEIDAEDFETPEKPKRPGKNASKPEWQAYAEALGHSSEGSVKQIIARIDAESGAEPETEDEVLSKLIGEHLPISAQAGDLTASVFINPAGIPVLSVAITGMIGDDGLVIPASQAGDFTHVLDALRDLARTKLA